ncbi:MAG TPA: fused MFS/spermidine synthase [Candidatus Polarisedimenticolia bacterium]|nr:fused MFS/spermidine synthase [Candidatus Polarisedimenticolia bacterium]
MIRLAIRFAIRFAPGVAVNGAAFFALSRILPFFVLHSSFAPLRLGLFLLGAAIAATSVAVLTRRFGEDRRLATIAIRLGLATVAETALLLVLLLIAPAIPLNFQIPGGSEPGLVASVLAIVAAAAILAATALAADTIGDRIETWLRGELRRAVAPRMAIFTIFLLSGAAGLVYEVVWSRQLVLVFGNTTQAVSAILTGFFGGMAIGSVIGGRIADRVKRPLRLYGLIELVLVGIVLATPLLFRGIHELYRAGYAGLEQAPTTLALLRYGLALLALAPATVLMGATLPTLSRHLSRRRAELGSAFGRLYSVNTIGAIVGTAVAGLILIELLGLTGTLLCGAAASGFAGFAAILIDRRDRTAGRSSDAELAALADAGPKTAEPTLSPSPASLPSLPSLPSLGRLPLVVAFVSGLTSLGYQLLWTRLLASGSGNTTYIFTTILVLFLIGIAAGAAFVARRVARGGAWSGAAAIERLGVIQVVIAAIVLSGLFVLSGQIASVWFIVRVVLVVVPATLAIGLTLPLTSALVAGRDDDIGRDAGLILGLNTLGAIGGTFVVPFFLIPAIGSTASLVVLAIINLGLGLALMARSTALASGVRRIATAAGVGLAVLAVIALAVPNPLVADPGATRLRRESVLLADAEDEIAAVQAGGSPTRLRLLVGGTGMTRLTVAAKVMTYLPLMTRPESTRQLVICFGMGSSYRAGLIAGLDVDGVELVPSVPDMFRYFYPDAPNVLADPDGRLVITDGRNYVELSDQTYDLIVVDPPPPIESSGTSILYSHEFYTASAKRLLPGGVMMEWMPYGQSVDEFRSHVRTFAGVFPNVLIAFGPTGQGVYMLGSTAAVEIDPANVRAILERPGVLDDLIATPDNPATSLDAWADIIGGLSWLSGSQVAAFADDAPAITDDRPVTEYFLLRRLFRAGSPPMNEKNLRAATPPG